MVDAAHQVVAQRGLVHADGFGLLQHRAHRGRRPGRGRQFVQHALAELEDRDVVDVFPDPAPMRCQRADDVGVVLDLAQRMDARVGQGQLLLEDECVGQHERRDLGRGLASGLGFVGRFSPWRRDAENARQAIARAGLACPQLGDADEPRVQRLGRRLDDVVAGQRFLRTAQGLHDRRGSSLEPSAGFRGLRHDGIAQPRRGQGVEQLGGGNRAQPVGIDGRRGKVRHACADALAGVVQHVPCGVGGVRELPFDDDAQAAQPEEHVGPVCAAQLDRLGVRADAELRDQHRKLRIDDFFSMTHRLPRPACRDTLPRPWDSCSHGNDGKGGDDGRTFEPTCLLYHVRKERAAEAGSISIWMLPLALRPFDRLRDRRLKAPQAQGLRE